MREITVYIFEHTDYQSSNLIEEKIYLIKILLGDFMYFLAQLIIRN